VALAALALVALAGLGLAAGASPAQAQSAGGTGGTGGARAAQNLLANPGFEEGGLFNPTDWDTTVAGVPTVLFYWDPDVKRSGSRSISIVNAGDAMPVWHNWNQMILDGQRFRGRDLELSVWVRSAQLTGRGYVMLQVYRDTVTIEARRKGITRDEARQQMGFKFADDPQLELGWARQYFSAELSDWTQQKVRCYVPPTANLIVIRCGIYGAGQVWFDDAQLVSEPAKAPPATPLGRNLLANPGFERPLDDWEFSMPPTATAMVERDSTVAHSGRASVLLTSQQKPGFETYMNVSQVFNARNLAGKRVRLSGWVRLEGLDDKSAYLSIYSTGLYGVDGSLAGDALSGTRDWTFYSVEWDVPKDTYTVWARAGYQTTTAKCWWDDLKFEVLGNTPRAPAAGGKSGSGSGGTGKR
jgi:hypothetical protein